MYFNVNGSIVCVQPTFGRYSAGCVKWSLLLMIMDYHGSDNCELRIITSSWLCVVEYLALIIVCHLNLIYMYIYIYIYICSRLPCAYDY